MGGKPEKRGDNMDDDSTGQPSPPARASISTTHTTSNDIEQQEMGQQEHADNTQRSSIQGSSELGIAIAESESDLLYRKAAIMHHSRPSCRPHNEVAKEPLDEEDEKEEEDNDDIRVQKKLAVGFGISEDQVTKENNGTSKSTNTRSTAGGKIRSVGKVTSVRELRTASGVLVERPEGLRRETQNNNDGVPGAHQVNGIGRHSPPRTPLGSTSRIDEESSAPSQPPQQPEQEPDEVLIEASLVNSSSFVLGNSRRQQQQQRTSSRRQTPPPQPILAHAKPMEENQPLSYKQICSSPKVLIPMVVIVLLAVVVGIALGVTQANNRNSGDNNDRIGEFLSPTVTPVLEPYDVTLPQSTLDAIQQPGSPQSLANSWMWQDPNLNTYSQARQRQRYALVTFYYATGGENWVDGGHWLNHSKSECYWGLRAVQDEGYDMDDDFITEEDFHAVWQANEEEIIADLSENERILACSADDRMINLVMVPNNLVGTLPLELFLFLPHLQYLDVAWNPLLVGSIPSEIGLLQDLDIFSAYDCSFSGTLPSEFGSLGRLQWLDIDHNQITGSIPTEIGLMSSLGLLFLGNNRLTGNIPTQLGRTAHLLALDLTFNDLRGSIPAELLRVGSHMIDLRLSGTDINGPLPKELSNLSYLELLELNSCGLTGSLPNLASWPRLQQLELSRNQFTGSIPSGMETLKALHAVFLGDNQLSGTMPREMGQGHKLSEIHLKRNQLTGTLPSTLGQVRSMVVLDASHNPISGNIPSELGLLDFLERLSLHETLITGTIPTAICEKEDLGLLKLDVDCNSVECCTLW